LDSRGIKVDAVVAKKIDGDWVNCSFCWETRGKSVQELEKFGTPLSINVPIVADVVIIRIQYETTADCTAAQWLTPSQTREKKFPFLFTQCQAIHARSLVPCQDSPFLKITYSASVTVPDAALVAVMSAIQTNCQQITPSTKVYSFEQKIPIPVRIVNQ
jgi:leukotriene-A4 hydrolase